MHKHNQLLAKCASGILSFSLIISMFPSAPAWAEEDFSDDEYVDEETLDEAEAEESSSVFYITKFVNFDKDSEGHFTNDQTKEKYGDLTSEPGTALEDLGLPENLTVEGYWESDGSDAISSMTLENIIWKLNSDTDEEYTEASSEGTYTFVPDYEAYVMEYEDLDDLLLADGVKDLTIDVQIAAVPEETESESESETESEADVSDGNVESNDDVDLSDLVSDAQDSVNVALDNSDSDDENSGDVALDGSDSDAEGSGDVALDGSDSDAEGSGDVALDGSDSDAEDSDDATLDDSVSDAEDVNIFDNLNDSLIDADNQEEYKNSEDGTVTLLPENSDSQPVVTDGSDTTDTQEDPSDTSNDTVAEDNNGDAAIGITTQDGTAADSNDADSQDSNIDTSNNATAQDGNTDTSDDAAAQDGYTDTSDDAAAEDDNSEDSDTAAPEEPAEQTLTGSLIFLNADDDTVIYQYPSDDNSTVSFTAGEVTSLTSIQLPCNAELDNLAVQFVLSDDTSYDLTQADFTDGATKRITFTDGTDTYSLDLALTKAAHNYDAATCEHLATCQNCGATIGDYADHVSANNETCTKNATCSVCGAELEGTALGHDWKPATCTTPKTCTRCNATEGAALGHDLRDDWETVEESTYTSHGYQERYCHRDNCDYSETRDLNIVGNPTDNAIQNLSEGATYDINSRLTFSAYGAASENTSPIDNDIRYIPSTWSIQNTTGTWLDNYSGAFSISKTGTYTVTVTFQKQVYGDGSWQSTDIADSKSVTFSIGGTSTDGSNDAVRINPQTGDQTQILPFVIILAGAAIVIIVILVLRKKKKQ